MENRGQHVFGIITWLHSVNRLQCLNICYSNILQWQQVQCSLINNPL